MHPIKNQEMDIWPTRYTYNTKYGGQSTTATTTPSIHGTSGDNQRKCIGNGNKENLLRQPPSAQIHVDATCGTKRSFSSPPNKLPMCQRLKVLGEYFLVQQCTLNNISVGMKETKFGQEPSYKNFTVGKDGFSLQPFE